MGAKVTGLIIVVKKFKENIMPFSKDFGLNGDSFEASPGERSMDETIERTKVTVG